MFFGVLDEVVAAEPERRDEVRSLRLHDGDRPVVDVRSVLDRVDAGLGGKANPFGAMRVRGDAATEAVGVGDDGLELVERPDSSSTAANTAVRKPVKTRRTTRLPF